MHKTRILLLTLIIAFIFGAAFSIAGESMKTDEICVSPWAKLRYHHRSQSKRKGHR